MRGSRLSRLLSRDSLSFVSVARMAALVVAAGVVGAAVSFASGPAAAVPWGFLVGGLTAFVVLARGVAARSWGPVTSWAVVALVAAFLSGSWVWLDPSCLANPGLCARASATLALLGVAFVVWAALCAAGFAAVRAMALLLWKAVRGRRARTP